MFIGLGYLCAYPSGHISSVRGSQQQALSLRGVAAQDFDISLREFREFGDKVDKSFVSATIQRWCSESDSGEPIVQPHDARFFCARGGNDSQY
jgi:hypothetical protein